MIKGFCPTCQSNLNDENVLVTRESEIFKGHNVYVMCKGCGLIMMYNEAREALFSLDRFKEDEDVLNEIKTYLSEVADNARKEVQELEKEQERERKVLLKARDKVEEVPVEEVPVEEKQCDGNCANCSQECDVPEIEEFYDISEEQENKEPVNLDNVLYMVHKRTDERRFISANDLHLIKNLDDWMFYEFQPVMVEPVVSYKIHRL